jgi:hypothetical protein
MMCKIEDCDFEVPHWKAVLCQNTCQEHCSESKDGKHKADPHTLQPVRGADWIVDVNCIFCGQSTGIQIDPTKIQW